MPETYENEIQMYPDIMQWLRKHLENKYPKAAIEVFDTHSRNLNRFLIERDFYRSEYATYEIKVDITGILREGKEEKFAFIECKLNQISLRDISQLLGYSRVACPVCSFLLGPQGFSDAVNLLFKTYRRYDVLEYMPNRMIILGKWDKGKMDIDMSEVIPAGSL